MEKLVKILLFLAAAGIGTWIVINNGAKEEFNSAKEAFNNNLEFVDNLEKDIKSKKETVKVDSDKLYKVIRVIDGDTIIINYDEKEEKIRYIGINAPESAMPDTTPECFGIKASAKNKELVEGKEVKLVRDVSDRDKYGRLLRYVYVGDILVNETLVREGYANAGAYPPDVAKNNILLEAERQAREEKTGLWGECRE